MGFSRLRKTEQQFIYAFMHVGIKNHLCLKKQKRSLILHMLLRCIP